MERRQAGLLQNVDQIRRIRLLIFAKAIDAIIAEMTIRILKLENDEMYGRMSPKQRWRLHGLASVVSISGVQNHNSEGYLTTLRC